MSTLSLLGLFSCFSSAKFAEEQTRVVEVGVGASGRLLYDFYAASSPLLLETLLDALQVPVLERMSPSVVPLHEKFVEKSTKTVS